MSKTPAKSRKTPADQLVEKIATFGAAIAASTIRSPAEAQALAETQILKLKEVRPLRRRTGRELAGCLRAILSRSELYDHLTAEEVGDIRASAEHLERFGSLPSFREKVDGIPPKRASRLGPMKPKDVAALLEGLEGKAKRAKKAWAFCEVLHEPVIAGVDEGADGTPVVRRKAGPIVQATVVMILEVPTSSGKKGKG